MRDIRPIFTKNDYFLQSVAPTAPPAVVVVLGMHRSGTSLLARLLNLAGLPLGPASALAGPAEDNLRGFWEHVGLRDVSDEVLRCFGGSWMAPPQLPAGWLEDPRVEALRVRAQEILARDFGGRALWGFKDPRVSLLVPFWRRVLPAPIAWILAVRSPREVAASLARRDSVPWPVAEDLWNEYTRRAIADAPECLDAIVHYSRLLEDPVREIERLRDALGLPLPPFDEATRQALAAEAHPEMRHHQDPGGAGGLAAATRSLLARLETGRGPDPDDGWQDRAAERSLLRAVALALSDELAARRTAAGALSERSRELLATQAELDRWREEAQQLRHQSRLLQARPETRAGEAFRRLWRRLRQRSRPSSRTEWRTREDSNL